MFRCGAFLPGHDVHWIQAFHALMDSENPPIPGQVVAVEPNGVVVVETGGRTWRLWNHDPERLTRLVGRNEGVVQLQWRWRLPQNSRPRGLASVLRLRPIAPTW
jgi:hypothetical protein